MHSPKYTAKDSVFRDLFQEPKYLLQLYQALHAEDTEATEEDLEIITIEQIMMDGIYNDLGFLVKDRLMVLVEAQSTWSENIVIRSLIYLMSTYQEYLHRKKINRYSSKKVKLPVPELYMIYTKERGDHPEVLSLKDSFFKNVNCAIDAKVKVIYLDDSATIINQYIGFCTVFDEQRKIYGSNIQAVRETIRICVDRDLLREYLEGRRTEVEGIMLTLFSQEWVDEIRLKEARDEGEANGITKGIVKVALNMLRKNRALDLITEATNLSADEVRKIARDNNLSVV